MTRDEFRKILASASRHSDLSLAWDQVNRAEKIRMIVMGENCQYWVVRPVDFEKLIKAGYEPAPRLPA